jgi:hypothetical protein
MTGEIMSKLQGPGQRLGWLVTDGVMGNLGLRPEECRGYEAYLEGRVLEVGIEAAAERCFAERASCSSPHPCPSPIGWERGDLLLGA